MEIFIIIRYLVLNTHKEHILYQSIEMFCIIIFSCRKSNLSRFSGDRLARPSTMFPAVLNNLSVFLEVGVGVRNLLANLQRATLALTSFPASSYLLPRLGLFYSQGAGRDNCIPVHSFWLFSTPALWGKKIKKVILKGCSKALYLKDLVTTKKLSIRALEWKDAMELHTVSK